MSQPITIGIDFGSYSFVNDTRVITLANLDGFVPTQSSLAYVLNETQDIIYYAPSPQFMRATIDGVTIVLDDESKPTLKTDDILHIQFFYPVNLQNPIPSDGDSIYIKDIDWDNSDFTDWVGDSKQLFQSPFSTSITNDTNNNPKIIVLAFQRTVSAVQVGFGENNSGDFSNVKVSLLGSSGAERSVYDNSNDSTKKTSLNAIIGDELFNSIKIEFYTSDRIDLSNITIQKAPYSVIENNPQNAIPISSDSVYPKDLDLSRTIITDWVGGAGDLFGDLTKGVINSTGDNPKTLILFFKRTIVTNAMGLGADIGNFSNVKITALLSGSAEFVLFDGSADSTLRTSQTIQFAPLGFVGVKLEFSTANTITLTNLVIIKSIATVSRLQALKPNGLVTNIDATAGGNLKVSVEELENQISSNSNSQLNVTLFNEEGIPASIDASTETLQTIDHSHHKILEGDAYTAKVQAEGGVGTKATITFTTSDTAKWMHIIIHARSNVEAHYTLGESPTITADTGTNFIVYNRNRNSDNESLTKGTRTATAGQMTEGATVTNLGTILEQVHLGSGRAGGENRSDDEWVLKQNTTYVLECESEAATSDVLIEIDWYEHTNKN